MTPEQITEMRALEKKLKTLKDIEEKEKAERKQVVVRLIAEKTAELNRLYSECEKLAREVDIEFYFHSGYAGFVTDPNSSWDSSRC